MPLRHHFATPLFAGIMLIGAFHISQTPAHAQNACDQELLMDTRATGRPNANTQPCRELNTDNRSIQQQAQARIEARNRWNALAPAVEPGNSTLELLFQIYQSLPSPDTRITQCNLAPDQCVLEGEAPGARQAVAFAENLKARPELSGFHFESDPPLLLPNEHAQFRISGKP